MPADRIARQVRVEGQVQGVGFRAFVCDAAEAAGVAGHVRNMSDGSVDALLVGEESAVERVEAAIRRGPPGSQVERVSSEAADVTFTPTGFSITR